jgi:hypothetical protein
MLNPRMPQARPSLRDWVRRLDRIAADLNVLLLVIALGLATLDFTFYVTEKVIDNLPPITHVNYDTPDTPAK